jgi:protein O-mannosyl-transferase
VNLFDNNHSALRALPFCILLVAVCYATSLTNAFILDDILIVAANERIRTIEPLRVLFEPYWGDQDHAGIYRPLTIFSFSLEYPVWKVWAPGFRFTNLLLHALNGWLVFLLARGLLVSALGAWATAAVYIAHPLQSEAVISIVGRSELLAAAFFFSAWLAFRKGYTGIAAAAYLLGALAKESAITFPAIAALDMALTNGGVRRVMREWWRFAILGVTGIAYLALRFYVLGGLGIPPVGQYLHGTVTIAQRWLTSGRVFLGYFTLLVFPVNVTGDYDFNSIPLATVRDWDALLGLALVAGCLYLAVRLARNHQKLSLGILFFFLTLLPVSNWIMPIALLMAERFLYTPVFGFALLVGAGWAAIPDVQIRRLAAGGALAIAIILCIAHNYVWQDPYTFHVNAVRVFPNNARARLGYGFALRDIGRLDDAAAQFDAGLKIMPQSPALLAGLASTYLRRDAGCDRVRPLLAQALALEPGQWHSLWVLGDCFAIEGKTELAATSYERAIHDAQFPDARLLFSWGRILEKMGNTTNAVAAYERAALIDPDDESIKLRLRLLKN